jgi:hypothetical protein
VIPLLYRRIDKLDAKDAIIAEASTRNPGFRQKGAIGVSRGDLLAANLENPGLMTLFEKHMNIMNLPQRHISIPGIA